MTDCGWIKLHRKIKEWEWYTDLKVSKLFFHLLLTVNHTDARWQGKVILAGQTVTSYPHLARETGLSLQNVKTAVKKLVETGEITVRSTNKYTVISVVNWREYQTESTPDTRQLPAREEYSESNRQDNAYIMPAVAEKQDDFYPSNQKTRYGQYNNVLLAEDEVEKLKERFGFSYKEKIDQLSEGIALKGYRYTSHYLALLKWFKDAPKEEDDLILMSMDVVPVFKPNRGEEMSAGKSDSLAI